MALREATKEEIDNLTPVSEDTSAPEVAPEAVPVPQADVETETKTPFLPDRQGASQGAPAEAKTLRRATGEEISNMIPLHQEESDKEANDGSPGFLDVVIDRALGRDVDDKNFELERIGTTLSSAWMGGSIGSRVPTVNPFVNPITGAIVGGLVGAIAGSVAPEATLEAMEFLGVVPKGTRERLGLSNEELKTIVKGEAALELTTAGLAGGFRATGRAVGRKITKITKESEILAERAAAEGIDLAPFQVGASDLGKDVINVLARFPFIGSRARKVGQASEATIKVMKETLPERVVPLISQAKLGTKIFNESRALVKSVSKGFEVKYGELFLEANELGVKYNPKNTRVVGGKLITELKKRRLPAKGSVEKTIAGLDDLSLPQKASVPTEVERKAAKATESMIAFVEKNILNLDDMSLAQMDELLMKVSQHIGGAKRGTKAALAKLMVPLKKSIELDIATNGIGKNADEIGKRLKAVDKEFNEKMSFLFETSAGKKFSAVRKGGLRGTTLPSQEATRTAVDKLAKLAIDIDSPQAMKELARLVEKKTFNQVGAKVLANIFDKSMVELADKSIKLDADKLAMQLGRLGTDTSRKEALSFVFKEAGLSEETISTLVDSAIAISKSPIPNWSTFIARRASIGGAKSVIRGVMPFLALSGGGAAAGGGMGALVGGMMFLGGSKMLISVISNPASARAFKSVVSKEASMFVKRAAFMRLARAGITEMQTLKEFSKETAKTLFKDAQIIANELFPNKKGEKNQPLPDDLQAVIDALPSESPHTKEQTKKQPQGFLRPNFK